MSPKNLIFAVFLGVALAAGIYVATIMNKPAELRTAFILPSPTALPEFSLLNQSAERVDGASFRGQWDLVFFGFTHCPDICPTTLHVLANARRQLAESGVENPPRIVLVSVDPERDTPEVLEQYVDYFGEGILGVTGELDEIQKLTAALGIYFAKSPAENGNYGVDHSAAVLIFNPDGEFAGLFSAPHTTADYVNDLPIIMDSY